MTIEEEITKSIYDEYKKQYLICVSQEHKTRRNIEYSELSDNTLYKRARKKPSSIGKIIENKELAEEMKEVFDTLTEIQKRRFKLYYIEKLTYREIAETEGVYYTSVRDSLELVRKKFEKFFK